MRLQNRHHRRRPTRALPSPDCHSYYRNASGHTPFLFPGNFKTYSLLHAEIGLHEFEVA